MKYALLSLYIIFLFSACSKTPNIYSNDIRLFSSISPVSLPFDTVYQMPAGFEGFYVIDSLLLYITNQPNALFQVYHEDKCRAIFGSRGKGPDEFINTSYNGQFYREGNDLIFWLNDITKKELKAINLSESINQNKLCIQKTIHLPLLTDNCILLSDTLFFLTQEDNNTHTIAGIFYNPVSQKQKTIPLYLPTKLEISGIYGSFWEYNPLKGCLVTAMPSVNQINFLQWGNNQKYASIPHHSEANTTEVINKTTEPFPSYYGRITTNPEAVYALYWGKDEKNKSIFVLDWEGNLIKSLQIKEDLSGIRVDHKNHYLYGFSYENEKMYRYNLYNIRQ